MTSLTRVQRAAFKGERPVVNDLYNRTANLAVVVSVLCSHEDPGTPGTDCPVCKLFTALTTAEDALKEASDLVDAALEDRPC